MMKAFFQGWRTAFRSWRIALTVYGFQFLLAMILGMLVYNSLGSSIGNSLELKKLLFDYDHTVIQDIANVHGNFLAAMQGGLPWVVLGWMIFSTFISGGLLFTVVKRMPSWDMFWAGGARFFSSFLKMGVFFLLVTAVLSAAIWIPLVSDWQAMVQKLPSEREYIFVLIGVFILYLLLLLFIFSWATVSKLIFIKEEEKTIWQSIKSGLIWASKNFFKTEGLLILFSLVQLIVVFIYWQIEGSSGMVSPTLIFVFFLIQQLLIFFRIMWRIAVYRGLDYLHNASLVRL